ncbi:hypothetical protein BOX15_Mlig030724g1, partial [Macrostomum lignano]
PGWRVMSDADLAQQQQTAVAEEQQQQQEQVAAISNEQVQQEAACGSFQEQQPEDAEVANAEHAVAVDEAKAADSQLEPGAGNAADEFGADARPMQGLDSILANTDAIDVDQYQPQPTQGWQHQHPLSAAASATSPTARQPAKYICRECGRGYANKSSLRTHARGAHADLLGQGGGGAAGSARLFNCPHCDFASPFRGNLDRHVLSQHTAGRERSFGCQQCGQMFYTASQMREHCRSVHSDSSHRCEQCGKQFNTKLRLRQHMDTHNPTKPHVCDMPGCERAFRTAKYLKNHKDEFHKLQPHQYNCPIANCGAVFYKKTHMKRHMEVHGGAKSFRCLWPDCERAFRTHGALQIHRYKHTGEKPLGCGLCEYRCRQKICLFNHHRRAHPDTALPAQLANLAQRRRRPRLAQPNAANDAVGGAAIGDSAAAAAAAASSEDDDDDEDVEEDGDDEENNGGQAQQQPGGHRQRPLDASLAASSAGGAAAEHDADCLYGFSDFENSDGNIGGGVGSVGAFLPQADCSSGGGGPGGSAGPKLDSQIDGIISNLEQDSNLIDFLEERVQHPHQQPMSQAPHHQPAQKLGYSINDLVFPGNSSQRAAPAHLGGFGIRSPTICRSAARPAPTPRRVPTATRPAATAPAATATATTAAQPAAAKTSSTRCWKTFRAFRRRSGAAPPLPLLPGPSASTDRRLLLAPGRRRRWPTRPLGATRPAIRAATTPPCRPRSPRQPPPPLQLPPPPLPQPPQPLQGRWVLSRLACFRPTILPQGLTLAACFSSLTSCLITSSRLVSHIASCIWAIICAL